MKEINLLEKRIAEKAKERFDKEFIEFTRLIDSNPIGKKLKIFAPFKIEEEEEGKLIPLVNFYGTTGGTYFNGRYNEITKYGKELTNIKEIESDLIERYIKEETDSILDRLNVLSNYLQDK